DERLANSAAKLAQAYVLHPSPEQRVRDHPFHWIHFESHNVRGKVVIVLSALVALDAEAAIERRHDGVKIRLGKRDRMTEESVLLCMKSPVLADHDPVILLFMRHRGSPLC